MSSCENDLNLKHLTQATVRLLYDYVEFEVTTEEFEEEFSHLSSRWEAFPNQTPDWLIPIFRKFALYQETLQPEKNIEQISFKHSIMVTIQTLRTEGLFPHIIWKK